MDGRPNHSHSSSAKPPPSPTHHAPIPGRSYAEVAGETFIPPPHPSTKSPYSAHTKAGSTPSGAIPFHSNGITPSAIATVSLPPSITKLPKATTPLQTNQQPVQPSTTNKAMPIGQSGQNNNTAGILGPVLGVVVGLIVVGGVFLWVFLRRRKRNQHRHRFGSSPPSPDNEFSHPTLSMETGDNKAMRIGHGNSSASPGFPTSAKYSRTLLRQPSMSRDAKRLTADTVISTDRRSSLSTMTSKRQYMPQLAYSLHGIDKNDLLFVSPSNTLIDGFSMALEDDEKQKQQQQQQPHDKGNQ